MDRSDFAWRPDDGMLDEDIIDVSACNVFVVYHRLIFDSVRLLLFSLPLPLPTHCLVHFLLSANSINLHRFIRTVACNVRGGWVKRNTQRSFFALSVDGAFVY